MEWAVVLQSVWNGRAGFDSQIGHEKNFFLPTCPDRFWGPSNWH